MKNNYNHGLVTSSYDMYIKVNYPCKEATLEEYKNEFESTNLDGK